MDHQLTFPTTNSATNVDSPLKRPFSGTFAWKHLESIIKPHYPKTGNGRDLILFPNAASSLHADCYSLSDPAMEDALYKTASNKKAMNVIL